MKNYYFWSFFIRFFMRGMASNIAEAFSTIVSLGKTIPGYFAIHAKIKQKKPL